MARKTNPLPLHERVRDRSDEELIELAVKHATQRFAQFNPGLFDRISVRRVEKGVFVDFEHSIVFLPLHSRYVTEITIGWAKGLTKSFSSRPNPSDTQAEERLYVFDEQMRAKAELVLEAMSEGGFNMEGEMPKDLRIVITERDDHYAVSSSDPGTTSHCKVHKDTMKVYDSGHKHKRQ